MDRTEVTKKIVSAKVKKGLKWDAIAKQIGQSKEWTTAALLGQMQMTKKQAEMAGELFGLNDEEMAWLQIVPYKGSLPTAVPTDPLIYRWYEIVSVYGSTIKELIPRGIRRRHHERHRLLDGHRPRARPQGRPRARGAVGQVPPLQDLLNLPAPPQARPCAGLDLFSCRDRSACPDRLARLMLYSSSTAQQEYGPNLK